jgi:hypothetical protein
MHSGGLMKRKVGSWTSMPSLKRLGVARTTECETGLPGEVSDGRT